MDVEKIDNMMTVVKTKEEKIHEFSEMLDSLTTVEDKKKALWKDVYMNAVQDRHLAYTMFEDLFLQTQGNSTAYATNGSNLAKYLERMSKSNDQILKLVELISQEEEKAINIDQIFESMNNG